MDTRHLGGVSSNSLEPDWHVVQRRDDRTVRGHGVYTPKCNSPLPENPEWNGRTIPSKELHAPPGYGEHGEETKKQYASPVAPRIVDSTPLQDQKQADDRWNDEDGSGDVECIEQAGHAA